MKKEIIIGLCDDEKNTHLKIIKYLKEYEKAYGVDIETISFYSGKELIENKKQLDMLFLDFSMPEMNGIQTAEELNRQDLSYKIVMLTSKTECFKDAFKVGAFRFVTKPIHKEELFETIIDVQKTILGNETVQVYRDNIRYNIIQKQIYYIMSEEASTKIYTERYQYRSEWSLLQWEKILDSHLFFRCHKSFIVNIGKIAEIEASIVLANEEKVMVSRRKRAELRKKFIEFDINYR